MASEGKRKPLPDFERGRREGLRQAMRAIAEWHNAADADQLGDATSGEIVTDCARAVNRKLEGRNPAVDDDVTHDWPAVGRIKRKRKATSS